VVLILSEFTKGVSVDTEDTNTKGWAPEEAEPGRDTEGTASEFGRNSKCETQGKEWWAASNVLIGQVRWGLRIDHWG
jgi:hypothetical protein